jgi:hypothetical protein
VPRLRCRAQPATLRAQKLATVKRYREDYRCLGRKKRFVCWRTREIRSVPRHAEFSRWREWIHAADLIGGGERSWISAAVSLSMTFTVIGDGSTMSAAHALIEITAECGGTTPLDGPRLPTKPVAVSFDERLSCSADDIGHLQRRPAHLFLAVGLVASG